MMNDFAQCNGYPEKYGLCRACQRRMKGTAEYQWHTEPQIDEHGCLLCIPALCPQCRKPIDVTDDDALVCIECGGQNRRVPTIEAKDAAGK